MHPISQTHNILSPSSLSENQFLQSRKLNIIQLEIRSPYWLAYYVSIIALNTRTASEDAFCKWNGCSWFLKRCWDSWQNLVDSNSSQRPEKWWGRRGSLCLVGNTKLMIVPCEVLVCNILFSLISWIGLLPAAIHEFGMTIIKNNSITAR